MSDLTFIISSLKSRWLNSVLSMLLTAFGVMLALIMIQFGHHIQDRLSADGKGIDIVVGAKGSPLQLILSSVYHVDIPTGNIPYADAQKWMKHRHIKTAIPLALGDNWHGYRIVGTTDDYMAHYNADIVDGREWNKPFEAVIGADIDLAINDEFAGAHGLVQGGHEHHSDMYKVVGVMQKTGTVLDRLILTSLDSVLELHGMEGVEEHEEDHEDHSDHGHDHENSSEKSEITALLLTTKSPIATMNLPRSINRNTALQAVTPALEMARLTSMLGLGTKSFTALSIVLISISALSIFAGLAGSLENRMGDLAVLRAIGYSKARIFKLITLEGMMIVFGGVIIGVFMGIYGFIFVTNIVKPLSASGAHIAITSDFVIAVLAVMIAGLIASALPAIRAMRVDAATQLMRNG